MLGCVNLVSSISRLLVLFFYTNVGASFWAIVIIGAFILITHHTNHTFEVNVSL